MSFGRVCEVMRGAEGVITRLMSSHGRRWYDRRFGKWMRGRSSEMEEWPGTETCSTEKCPPGCGTLAYDRLIISERIRRCLAQFPDML
ncbi:hypothetical protein EV421DRAFT_2022194 [Armillaria borealis]|uniref:Uncharacterized protein n=1 Tax=Armillaria borealis TaxID=47425 RepID=A0AA39J7J8_9AGAR|nr:hypothetical protein EV421DRAFT_2022194 [Armillaria borealis]